MKRVQIVAYVAEDDIDSDVDRAVSEVRHLLCPELVVVSKMDITEERLAEILKQSDDAAL